MKGIILSILLIILGFDLFIYELFMCGSYVSNCLNTVIPFNLNLIIGLLGIDLVFLGAVILIKIVSEFNN